MLYQVPALTGDGSSSNVSGHGPFFGGELSYVVLENSI